jgi:hypothetical protein
MFRSSAGAMLGPSLRVYSTTRNASATDQAAARNHSRAVYHIRGTPAQFVGIVYDGPEIRRATSSSCSGVRLAIPQRAISQIAGQQVSGS